MLLFILIPINPPSQIKSHIHVFVDAFNHFEVILPIKSNIAKTAIKTVSPHWILKFGPPKYHIPDRESEYDKTETTHLCTLMGII